MDLNSYGFAPAEIKREGDFVHGTWMRQFATNEDDLKNPGVWMDIYRWWSEYHGERPRVQLGRLLIKYAGGDLQSVLRESFAPKWVLASVRRARYARKRKSPRGS